MKKKNLKTLKLQKVSISNFAVKGGADDGSGAAEAASHRTGCGICWETVKWGICCDLTRTCPSITQCPQHTVADM